MNLLGMADRIRIPDIAEFCASDPPGPDPPNKKNKNPDEEDIDLL